MPQNQKRRRAMTCVPTQQFHEAELQGRVSRDMTMSASGWSSNTKRPLYGVTARGVYRTHMSYTGEIGSCPTLNVWRFSRRELPRSSPDQPHDEGNAGRPREVFRMANLHPKPDASAHTHTHRCRCSNRPCGCAIGSQLYTDVMSHADASNDHGYTVALLQYRHNNKLLSSWTRGALATCIGLMCEL